jgi:hypothetical protein
VEECSQPRPDTLAPSFEGAAQILLEQFTYLLEHNGTCATTCNDCMRFRRLTEILLEPFRSEPYSLPPVS